MLSAITQLIDEIDAKLLNLREEYDGLSLRDKVLRLVEIYRESRGLSVLVLRDSGCGAVGARERIRLYLLQNIGVVIDKLELEVVAGISEYGRRVRELRVEDGYMILTGSTPDRDSGLDLRPSQYVLYRPEPDREAAYRWRMANRIRARRDLSAQHRILELLRSNVGKIITTDEIKYVANISDYQRRIRQLRTEEGYAIATINTGRPDLRPGEYVLADAERVAEPHDRMIPYEVQERVYDRDGSACRCCGGKPGAWLRPGAYVLQLHHVLHHRTGGPNNLENLVTVCNVCHVDVHAGRIVLPPEFQ